MVTRLRHHGALAEEFYASKESVVAFVSHEPDEDQDGDRRHQYGQLQRQPLPLHVHENRHDESGLHQHEDEDQRPAQISLQLKIVHHVGKETDDEQQSPDPEIDAERMLLPFLARHVR